MPPSLLPDPQLQHQHLVILGFRVRLHQFPLRSQSCVTVRPLSLSSRRGMTWDDVGRSHRPERHPRLPTLNGLKPTSRRRTHRSWQCSWRTGKPSSTRAPIWIRFITPLVVSIILLLDIFMVRKEVYGLQSFGRMPPFSLRRVAQCLVAWIKLRPEKI